MFASLLLLTITTLAPAQNDARVLDVNALQWAFDDERVVLGETKISAITLTAKRSDGSPLDIAPPTLKASTGSLSAPVRTAPGTWRTDYTPPKERFPHVAMLSAQIDTDAGLAVGFAAVPLWGKGRLNVKTKPSSKVIVSIGNLEFGPSKSDAKGIATVDIIAPPGPERAVAKSADEFGNTSQEIVDLGVPAFNRLSLIALDDVAAADGTGEAQLLLYLVDKKGEAMIDAPVEVVATVGGLKQLPQGISPGLFRLRYGPGTTKLKEALLDVALEGAKASKARAKIKLIPGGPTRATIRESVTTLTADAPRNVAVTVELFDNAGNPVPPTAGRVVVDTGRIANQTIDANAATYTWVLPALLPTRTLAPTNAAGSGDAPGATGAGSVEPSPPAAKASEARDLDDGVIALLSVRNRAGADIGQAQIQLLPGLPHQLTLSPLREMMGDGQDAIEVVASAIDKIGNPVSVKGLTFTSDLGVVTAPVLDGNTAKGLFVAAQLPTGSEPRTGMLVATLPITQGAALTATSPLRVSPIRLRPLLLVGVGVITDYNLQTAASFGPELSLLLRLPILDGQVHAGLRLAAAAAVLPPPTGSTAVQTQLAVPIWAEAQWRQELLEAVPELVFHFGGAVGVTMSDRMVFENAGVVRASAAAPTAMGIVGVGYPLGIGAVEADLHAGFGWPLSTKLNWAPMAVGLSVRYRFGL